MVRVIFHDTCTTRGSDVIYGPSKKLDFELELGYFVSKSLSRGKTLSIDEPPEYIFGVVLLNG
jgi:fumarylacetoacetase